MSLIVKAGTRVRLEDIDPNDTPGPSGGKKKALATLAKLARRLGEQQYLMFAEGRHRLLVVLQGMDTSGKDGVIRHVFGSVNPQGVVVASFKVPTPVELAHDFLWRVHQQVPQNGQIVIFNRSHYEDVLVVRVHGIVSKKECRKRFRHINDFEAMLTDEGVTILKFFLHISPDEQQERMEERLRDPSAQWKFNPKDLEERKLWPEYAAAYEDMLSHTSTDHAPWHVIRANHKWYRNLTIARTVVKTLKGLKLRFPTPAYDPGSIVIPD